MKMITIPQSIEGLETAAQCILDEGTRKPVVEALKQRRKWQMIKQEFLQLREGGMLVKDAIYHLSEKHFYSEKTIEAIVYNR